MIVAQMEARHLWSTSLSPSRGLRNECSFLVGSSKPRSNTILARRQFVIFPYLVLLCPGTPFPVIHKLKPPNKHDQTKTPSQAIKPQPPNPINKPSHQPTNQATNQAPKPSQATHTNFPVPFTRSAYMQETTPSQGHEL